jgi:hypothetical protein
MELAHLSRHFAPYLGLQLRTDSLRHPQNPEQRPGTLFLLDKVREGASEVNWSLCPFVYEKAWGVFFSCPLGREHK